MTKEQNNIEGSGKVCSICGIWQDNDEFSYGNRENRSYCKKCNHAEKIAYSKGGKDSAREFRETERAKWKS